MQQHTVLMSTVHDALRVLEDTPACVTKEVTKVEAMRLLVPQIRAMQAKGYTVAHIANVLSKTGISLTEATLKNYLHRFKLPTEKVPARKGKQTGTLGRTIIGQAATPPETRSGTSSDSVESPRRIPPPSPQDSAARRAGFTVRPDTKNI
jgi:hypothetical protein